MQPKLTKKFPQSMKLTITDEMVARYAEVSKDHNPIHLSEAAAQDAGFPTKVTHGMLTMALSTRFISPMLEKTWMIQQLKAKFLSPLYVNESLLLTADIQQEHQNVIKIKFTGKSEIGETIINGEAVLRHR